MFWISKSEWNNSTISYKHTFLSCKYFGKLMISNGSGSIINFSSASAGPPLSRAFPYSIAKAGVKNFTQNLARGRHNIGGVNCIRPGFFPTKWNPKIL